MMIINLSINTAEMTDEDRALLRALAGDKAEGETAAVIQMADRKAEQEAAAAPETPRRTRRTRKAAAEPVEAPADADDDSSSDEDDDLIGGDDEPTLDDAVARAKELVQSGKGSEVRKALKETGASRVKDLEGDDIATFLAAVKGK